MSTPYSPFTPIHREPSLPDLIESPLPWEWEEHELNEGYSCIVYDANGHGVPGMDHLSRKVAAQICRRANTKHK